MRTTRNQCVHPNKQSLEIDQQYWNQYSFTPQETKHNAIHLIIYSMFSY